ncbi:MAG: CNNM domain-containing protein, partial [Ruthenibacterium sp.]
MENQLVWQLLLQAALIALNAVFACAEIAVISFNDAKLAHMAAQGDKRAVALARLTSQPARFLATIQVAITLSGFLGSAFAASNFSFRLMQLAQEWNLPVSAATVETVSVILITLLLSYVTLVLGELVPKRIAMKKAETLALGMAGFISAISVLFKPLVSLLTASTNGILRLVGIDPNSEENEVTEEEIRMMVDVGTEKGTIASDEKEMIQNVFELNDLTVDEIATHRTDAAFLDDADTPEEWARFINSTRYSLYPICRGGLDNVVGVLNTKDYFRLADKSRATILHGAV